MSIETLSITFSPEVYDFAVNVSSFEQPVNAKSVKLTIATHSKDKSRAWIPFYSTYWK